MSVDTTLAVLYAQSGLSTNVANAAMVAPQASLAMTRVLAAEALRQEREQIEKLEKTDDAKLHPDKDGRTPFGTRTHARRKTLAREDPPQTTTPFTGNLLNIRI